MNRFAHLIQRLTTPGTDRAAALADYLRTAAAEDASTALALLNGQTPKRIASPGQLRTLAQTAADIPDGLFAACQSQTKDTAETIALLIPPPLQPQNPTLTETLSRITTPDQIEHLWASLLPPARVIANRLITGTFRTRFDAETLHRARLILAGQPLPNPAPIHEIRTLLTYAEVTPNPELTLALWQDGVPIPIARARASLPDPDQRDLLAWVRAHSQERFGPLHRVPATQVILLGYDALTPNRRRKSGVTLTNPRILQWLRGADPHGIPQISDLPLAGPISLPLDDS